MGMRSVRAALLGGVLAMAGGLTALAQEVGVTPDRVRIGMFAPLSGPSAAYGQDVLNAARMWFDKINREGGIHGRQIEAVVEDDRCNANDLVAAVKKLVEQSNVFALNGGSCSAAVVAASDYVVRNRVPLVMLNASGDGALFPPNDYIYGAFSISQHAAGGSAVEFAARHFNARRIAYVNHDDAYGAWNLNAAKFQAERRGAGLNVQSISPNITDVTAPMVRLRAANPEVLVIMTYARPAALIIRKAMELGYRGPIVVAVNATADLRQMVANGGGPEAFRNVYIQEVLADLPGSARLQWVYDMYRQAYPQLASQEGRPQVYMPYGLPSAMSVTRALEAAGPELTREKFLAALQGLDFDSGVMAGPIRFGPRNRAAQQAAIYIKYDGATMERVPGSFASDWRFE
ncbi:branched-chain amino acid transport system substrate-binding protein [Roseomonas rosea]|uniref:Branched-chain amino acid transport system substrate-binding protein n=1 Tax=Muricoccus roseus TaxID=198092 RepID=A0A1M6LSG8_9PROT|nr:ABC transporter substrate-binding protein [Roseomonas rosea]SHJ74139.1 branched-chain amino acid transport system substrate-binding protein [Roseomonas rosea]